MAPAATTPPVVEAKALESLKSHQKPVPANTSDIDPKRKIICFNGTIPMQDTGHIPFNSFGCGSERRVVLQQQIGNGARSFRDVSEKMCGSLDVPFNDGFEVMEEALDIDRTSKPPTNPPSTTSSPSTSSQPSPTADDVTISTDGTQWTPVWLHDCEVGHDKAKSLHDYKDTARLESDDGTISIIISIGDGVSDLPAAREADVHFARREVRLEEYCLENNLSYIPFDSFANIQPEAITIAKKDEVMTEGKGLPATFNRRANMWRRASRRSAVPVFALMSPRDEKVLGWPSIDSRLRTPLDGPMLGVPEGGLLWFLL